MDDRNNFHIFYFMPNFLKHNWNCAPRILSHIRCEKREEFLRPTLQIPYWSLLLAESGSFWFRIGRGKKAIEGECRAHQWIFFPPDTPLRRKILGTTTFHYFDLQFEESAPRALIGHGELRDAARLCDTIEALSVAVWDDGSLAWREHLLLDWFRSALWEKHSRPRGQSCDAEMEAVRVSLEENFAHKISLAALARKTHLTPVTLTRHFRAAIGKTPSEFLLQTRLDHARRLLLTTNLTLDAIAAQCGFCNGFYFSRMWTKHAGAAPAHYRRAHRA